MREKLPAVALRPRRGTQVVEEEVVAAAAAPLSVTHRIICEGVRQIGTI